MANKKNYKAITVRLPPAVATEIQERSVRNHRSMNEEFGYLVERALIRESGTGSDPTQD